MKICYSQKDNKIIMFRIRTEDEIAKLMLVNNCYKCIYLNNYMGTPEMPTSWCTYAYHKPDKLLCSYYSQTASIDLSVDYTEHN